MTPQEKLRGDLTSMIQAMRENGHYSDEITAAIIELVRERVSVVTPEMDEAAQECPSTYESWATMLNASALGAKT